MPDLNMPKYRLYIDEVGNHDMDGALRDPNLRYLSLTGLAMELDYVRTDFQPKFEHLKRSYFQSHPDDPIYIHHRKLMAHKYPFQALRDPDTEERFQSDFLDCLMGWKFTAFTAVLDKVEHVNRYNRWRYDPYHYCSHVLLERYAHWLERNGFRGDVMAESRGTIEDMRLKKSFTRFHRDGTDWVDTDLIQNVLTSKQLKLKKKADNIAGLQLVDMVAQGAAQVILAKKQRRSLPSGFDGDIGVVLIDSKYDRRPGDKRLEGWGYKWLP